MAYALTSSIGNLFTSSKAAPALFETGAGALWIPRSGKLLSTGVRRDHTPDVVEDGVAVVARPVYFTIPLEVRVLPVVSDDHVGGGRTPDGR